MIINDKRELAYIVTIDEIKPWDVVIYKLED